MSELMIRGPLMGGTGTPSPFTAGVSGAQRVMDAHARFAQAVLEGRVFSTGGPTVALSANSISLSATTTPIVGVWNPPTSNIYLIIWQAAVQVFINTLTTPVGSGALLWAGSVANSAISTGANPFNRKTMVATGSVAKGFIGGVALTGLTTTMTVFEAAHFMNTTPITHGTVTAVTTQMSTGGVQNFDGSLIVPPGGVLALLNTTSTTTCSAAAALLWEEVPILA